MDENQAQLEWEARAGRPAAGAAFAAVALVIGSFAIQASIGKGSTKKAESLRIVHQHKGAFLAYSVVSAVALIALSLALVYLYRVTKARRPEIPAVAAYAIVAGPVLLLVAGVLSSNDLIHTAKDFVTSGPQTEVRAKHLTDTSRSGGSVGIGLAGALAFALGVIMISINAIRAGLLSRFMGILGIILAATSILPILPPPVIQLFWSGALGLLFLGLWPGGGRGPAWAAVEAIPWPSAADKAAARQAEMAAARGDAADDEAEPAADAEPQPQRNPNARSRKRKKRGARR